MARNSQSGSGFQIPDPVRTPLVWKQHRPSDWRPGRIMLSGASKAMTPNRRLEEIREPIRFPLDGDLLIDGARNQRTMASGARNQRTMGFPITLLHSQEMPVLHAGGVEGPPVECIPSGEGLGGSNMARTAGRMMGKASHHAVGPAGSVAQRQVLRAGTLPLRPNPARHAILNENREAGRIAVTGRVG